MKDRPVTPSEPDALTRRDSRANVVHTPDLADEIVDQLWSDPDQLITGASMIKDGDRCTVVRLDVTPAPIIIKRYNRKGAVHTATHAVMRSRASWSWRNAQRLRDLGLHTPRPLALREDRLGLFRGRSFLITEHIPGTPLLALIESGDHEQTRLNHLAERFGRIWRTLGEHSIVHDDMKATNFIVDPVDELWLIDLDGMRERMFPPRFRRERRLDYERFMRNWQAHPEAAAAFRAQIDTD